MIVFYANLAGLLLAGGGFAGIATVAAIIVTDRLPRPVNLYQDTPTHTLLISTDPSDPWRLPFIEASPLARPIEYAAEYIGPSGPGRRKPSTTIRERYAYHSGSSRHGIDRADAILSTTLTDELKAESLSMYGQPKGTST